MARFAFESEQDTGTVAERRRRTKRPKKWKVILHNDDFTSMDFVVHVLMTHFRKSPPEATLIMLQVHHKGVGVAGVYTRDVAETKVAEVEAEARENDMPLLLTLEPAEERDDE